MGIDSSYRINFPGFPSTLFWKTDGGGDWKGPLDAARFTCVCVHMPPSCLCFQHEPSTLARSPGSHFHVVNVKAPIV